MLRLVRTAFSAASLAAVLAFGAPVAAQASTIYPPSGSCTVSPATVAPGESTTFRCAADTFSGDEDVTITVTGENAASASIGMLRMAITTASGHVTSESDGSLSGVRLTLPSDASGTYNVAAVSPTSAGGTAAITATNADGSLPATGLGSPAFRGLAVGGGALLLAGLVLAVATILRRRHFAR